MNKLVRHLMLAATVITLCLAASARDPMAAEKPALVVSIASVDRVLANVDYLTRATGMEQFGVMARFMATPYLEGLDTEKPVGILVHVADEPSGVAFVAVTDFAAVLAKISELIGPPEDVGGGVKEFDANNLSVFFKEVDGWVFVSTEAAMLNDLPANPGELLEGLDQDYEIAIRVNVPNIPQPLRQMAISEMKKGFEQSIASELDVEQRQLQEKLGGSGLEGLIRFVEEADQVTLGFGVDEDEGTTYLDMSVTALAGSKLAAQMADMSSLKSDFTGFIRSDAAATLHFSSPLPEEDQAQALLMLKVAREKALEEIASDSDLKNEQVRDKAKKVANALLDVLEDTIKSGKVAGGATLLLDGTSIRFVAGGHVADGRAVESSLKELAELAKSSPKAPTITFNAGQHGDVSLHTLALPVPEDEEEARRVFGDELFVVVGTGAKSVYLALGTGGDGLIKEVIDASARGNSSAPPMIFEVALGPILQFAANFEDDPNVVALAEALGDAQGKDHITIRARAIERGMSYRFGIEEGILQLIGKAVAMQNR